MTRPNNAVDHCCDTCLLSPRTGDTKCAMCKSLCTLGLPKTFVKRMVWAAHDFKKGGEGRFLVTSAELAMYLDKTDKASPGTTIRLPGEVKFVVDDSMVKCVACENETFAVQAEGEGWDHSTGGDGDPAMLCPDCIPAEPVER
jgi:hypothetical protein